MEDKSILIVDDERRMADSLGDLLREENYRVRTVYSGRSAVDVLRREQFHVVVTDLRMQEVGGLDLIRYIHDNFPETLVIVITGHASTDSAIEALRYQVFDYLRKPFEFDLFRMAIEKAFHKIEAERLRQDTAAMITHDIKIPLTSIIGFASMIYDVENNALHPRARDFAETIQCNGQKVLELIENYLTTCRVEAGTLKAEPNPVDLPQMVQEILEVTSIEARRHNRQFEVTTEGVPNAVRLDGVLVYRALSNLIQNAIKYTAKDGVIRIRVSLLKAEESGQHVPTILIEVTNPVEEAPPDGFGEQIFYRYQRFHGDKGVEGSGIGLYVVQAVALAHGGVATCSVDEGNMVRFSVHLPCPEPAKASS